MPVFAKWLITFVASYLLGSLSFAIIVSKGIYKKDIRSFGSGNAGMTNILRTFGKKAAALTITGDALKGTISVLVARMLFATNTFLPEATNSFIIFNREFHYSSNLYMEIAIYLAVLGSFLGHLYPCFFQFKGGKGVSVVAGSLIAATPITLCLALSIFLIIAFTTKIVSLSSIIACSSYFFITLIYFWINQTVSIPNLIASFLLPAVIVWSHRANIKRLMNGTEYKFGQDKSKK